MLRPDRSIRRYLYFILILLVLLLPGSNQPSAVLAQEGPGEIEAAVEHIFSALTPKERVGQLFMVSFHGADLSSESHIAELIQTYRVGGVIISAANKNFVNTSNTPVQVLELTNGLQRLAQEQFPSMPVEPDVDAQATAAITQTEVFTSALSATPYNTLPLFIAVSHEGDGYPYTEIRGGLTDIPSQMALGATWDTENAYRIGQIVGHELSTLGINMLLGPSLDVLDNPRPDRDGSLGTRTFGGSAYWVGEMGLAYIRGVHLGSNYQVLTVAKHFPGFGSSDRKINQGVPTILKSLDDLRRKELAPFFKVTQLNSRDDDSTGVTDGLMTVHIRYQGLQGGAPISLDARNLPAILALKEIAPWRESGGFVVSAPLGVPAALEGTSAARDSFPARRLAWDALWAGNDIMLVADFAFDTNPDREAANIKNAIGFFQEKYSTDANFKAAVDKAVKRIIRAKVKVYGPDLLNSQIEPLPDALDRFKEVARSIDLDKIAQAGVTPITPATQEGLSPLTVPPQPNDKIVIFTDDRAVRDCPDCPTFDLIRATALQEIILRLFGPDATGQVTPENITSLTFSDLKEALSDKSSAVSGEAESLGDEVAAGNGSTPAETEETLEGREPAVAENSADGAAEQEPDVSAEQAPVEPEQPRARSRSEITEAILNEADWVIFAMLNVDTTEHPESDAVKVLLRNRYEALRNKNLIVFAFSAPYFLDETEISQLTAYYCFYGSGLNYLEAAARLLFQQFKPTGALPVGIPAVSPLDLSPDPNQTIQLEPIHIIDISGNPISVVDQARNANALDLKVGEGVLFRTSVIMDKNGNPAPDGTLVNFFRAYPKEGLSLEPLTVSTERGVAEITIVKERESPLQVTVSSNLAVQSVPFNIGPGIIDTPTPTPTFTPTPTETPTPTPTLTPTPVAASSPTPGAPEPTVEPGSNSDPPGWTGPVTFIDLAYALLGMLLIGGIAFSLGEDRFSLEERVRPALVAIAFGLVGYISYTIVALAFPRSPYLDFLVQQGAAYHWVAPLVSLLFAISSMIAWYLKPGRIFWVKSRPGEIWPANRR